jgi:hypothetical protein
MGAFCVVVRGPIAGGGATVIGLYLLGAREESADTGSTGGRGLLYGRADAVGPPRPT